jgi:hypothetical protein
LADLAGAVDGRDVGAHAQGLIAGVAAGMGAGAGAGSRVFVRKIPLLVTKTIRKGGSEHRGLSPGATSPEAGAVPRPGVDDQVQHIRFLDARHRSAAGSVIWDADIFNFLLIRMAVVSIFTRFSLEKGTVFHDEKGVKKTCRRGSTKQKKRG